MRPKDPEFDWFDACPACQGRELRAWELSTAGYSVQNARVRCAGCGLIFSNPQASAARLRYFYEKVYFQQEDYKGSYFSKDMEKEQRAKAAHELAFLEEALPAMGSILDVGCAAGYFLQEARARGWKAEGSELSSLAAGAAKKKGFKVHVGEVEKLRLPRRFDALHAAHTLEHVKDPWKFLRVLRGFVKPGGLLLLEVPNAMHAWARIWQWRAKLKGRTPPLDYAKEHTFDFTRETLAACLEKSGWKVEALHSYEYEGGLLNLRSKPGDGLVKAVLRPAFAGMSKLLRLERKWGSYLQVLARN